MIRGGRAVLGTTDVARAVRFYIETLGMKLVAEAPGRAEIDAGDGFVVELREGAAPTSVVFRAKVPLAEAIAIYENRGVVFDPTATFHDDDGNVLTLEA